MSHDVHVCFLRVGDSQTKLGRLSALIHQHYRKGDRMMIRVENEEAAKFLDEWLWTQPPDSFLPHECSQTKTNAHVVISSAERNLNSATVLINLSSKAASGAKDYSLVYDLADQSHPSKTQLSRQRYQIYQSQGLAVSVI